MRDEPAALLIIDSIGNLRSIYDETIDLRSFGMMRVSRASHVEPDTSGTWWADLNPVQGPRLGPFEQRSQALAAERRWLQVHWLTDSQF